jgi:hypothetical protein
MEQLCWVELQLGSDMLIQPLIAKSMRLFLIISPLTKELCYSTTWKMEAFKATQNINGLYLWRQ